MCNVGFDGNGKRCRDTDECKKDLHDCDENAICTNFDGGFSCACAPGFSGDGKTCVKDAVDPCSTSLNPCDPNAICTANGDSGNAY